jgi:EmrB/QacA subfamily drug resistance transporter
VRLGKGGSGVAAATELQAAADRQAAAAHQPWGETLSRKRVGLVLASIMLGMMLAALDQTVVGTAMPKIIADLNGLQHYAWVATAYLLASTASMPIWGKLSDAYGRKRFFIAGMAVFLVGSALSGQSRSMDELIVFRAIQGLGAGAMMPIVQAILGDLFPPAQRAKWSGVLMSVFGFATIIGPLLGGWLTDMSTSGWRWCFYVNMPVGLLALIVAAVTLPGHTSRRKHTIDYIGSAVLVAAAVPLLLAFSWAGSTYAWGSWEVVGSFVFSIVMFVAFFFRELHAAEPVINPRLFTNAIFTVSAVASSLQSAAMFGAIMFIPLYVQGVMGKSATNSGITLMPLMLGAIVTSIGAGQVLSRTGRYKAMVIAGFVSATIGAYLLSRMGLDTHQLTLTMDMVVLGAGLGIAMSTFTVIVQNQYPTHRLGEVSAGLQFFRSIGGTMGMAVFGTILNNQFAHAMIANLPAPLHKLTQGPGGLSFDNPQVLLSAPARSKLQALFEKLFGGGWQAMFDSLMGAVRHSLQIAISDIFGLAVFVSIAGLVTVLFLKEVPLRRTHALVDAEAEGVPEPQVAAEGVEG